MEQKYDSNILSESLSSFSLKTYRAKEKSTLKDALKGMNLEEKYFAVLVNGKRVEESHELKENDEVVILPKIAGGIEKLL